MTQRQALRKTSQVSRARPVRRDIADPIPSRVEQVTVLALAFLGFILALSAIGPYGTGISRDSIEYLAAARNLEEGKGLTSFNGEPYILWPPLYPLALAFFGWATTVDPLVAGGWLNALLFGASIYLAGLFFGIVFRERKVWSIAGASMILVSPAIFGLAINLLSDLLFLVLCLLFMVAILRWYEAPRTSRLLTAGFLAGLAILARYIGFELVLLGAGVILFRQAPAERLRKLLTFGLTAGLPLLIWVIRNLAVSGSLLGPRHAARRALGDNLLATMAQLRLWLVPEASALDERLSLWLILLVFLAAGLLSIWTARSGTQRIEPTSAGLMLGFGALYLPLLVISASVTDVTAIDQRLVMPAYPAFILACCILLDGMLSGALRLSGWRLAVPVLVVTAIWAFRPASSSLAILTQSRADGVPVYNYLNTREFQTSAVVEFLSSNPLPADAGVYSNSATATYLYTGHPCAASPVKGNPNEREVRYPLADYLDAWPESQPAYLVWFGTLEFTHYYTPEELDDLYRLTPLFLTPDGGVYLVEHE